MLPTRANAADRRALSPRLLVITVMMTAAVLGLLLSACGSSSDKKSGGSSSAKPTVIVVPSRAAGNVPPGQPGREPPRTPAGGFAPHPVTPVATCAPAELLRLVNKDIALPSDFVPPDLEPLQPIDASPIAVIPLKLRHEANDAMHRMLEQARAGGLSIVAQSAYRSYPDQQRVYAEEVKNFGQAQADRESARPGHSEHQLGLAVDFSSKRLDYDLNDSFAATAEGKWLAQNAAQYGFVQSYPQDKEAITGYTYEPWHYRYIGVAPAQAVAQSGLTLNEWLAGRQLGCQP